MTQFIKGVSGNPAGKKPGSQNKRTQLAKLLEPHAESLINKAVELALNGDSHALRLCIERLIPKAKDKPPISMFLPNFYELNSEQIAREIFMTIREKELDFKEVKEIIEIMKHFHDPAALTASRETVQKVKEIMDNLKKQYEKQY